LDRWNFTINDDDDDDDDDDEKTMKKQIQISVVGRMIITMFDEPHIIVAERGLKMDMY
jgi:hypothetical protein